MIDALDRVKTSYEDVTDIKITTPSPAISSPTAGYSKDNHDGDN